MLAHAIWQALTHTPWWVYILFAYLLKVGYNATKTRTLPLPRLFILPSFFFLMSLRIFISAVQVNSVTLGTYILSLCSGSVLGMLLVNRQKLQFDKSNSLIRLPGSYATLILTLIIFATKYYFGYALATDPTKAQDTLFELCMLSVSGICAGLFLGRVAYYLYRKKNALHRDLSQQS